MSTETLAKETKLAEARDLLDAIMNFAYLHGFHECGYNPAKVLSDEIERLNKELETECGLYEECTMDRANIRKERDRLRQENAMLRRDARVEVRSRS